LFKVLRKIIWHDFFGPWELKTSLAIPFGDCYLFIYFLIFLYRWKGLGKTNFDFLIHSQTLEETLGCLLIYKVFLGCCLLTAH
jgi:hypothetical protein